LDFDFHPPKSSVTSHRRSTPRKRIWLFLVLVVLLLVPLFLRHSFTSTEANTAVPEAPQAPQAPPIPEIRKEIIKGTIAQGDTATALLKDFFSAAELHELGQQCKPVFPLSRLKCWPIIPSLSK